MEEKELIYSVTSGQAKQRADKFLSIVSDGLSRSRLQSLIADSAVMLNGEILTSASLKVAEGDVLTVRVPAPVSSALEAENIPLNIVYEDDDILVINKAAGMVVHPGAGNQNGTLVNALLYHCGKNLSGIGGVARLGIVHRLDKDTSGLMMVAKNDHAHQHLSQQLADRTLSRLYYALVLDVPVPIKGVIDRPIGRHKHHRLKMSVTGTAPREARTHYKVINNYQDIFALVACKLESGRTHQIRVHMKSIGHPLIGDPLYGPQQTKLIYKMKKNNYSTDIIEQIISFQRQALFARQITFIHPRTKQEITFESDMPDDMLNLLKYIEK